MTENLIIFNTRVVTPLGFSARCGKEMEQLSIIDNATVEVTDGIITYVGPNRGEERDGYYQHYCCLLYTSSQIVNNQTVGADGYTEYKEQQ